MNPRLDELLVERGLYPSRARARDAILRGTVTVAGAVECKPARRVAADAMIAAADPARPYVSRAALKLAFALDRFGLSPAGLQCLDIGASTGGFTQVLLERGARGVTALDVGHGQLAPEIAADPRVIAKEGVNARELARTQLEESPEFITCDVSFIPLRLALPPALAMAPAGAVLVALVKPQFEAGRAAVAGDGIVRDETARLAACEAVRAFLEGEGWTVLGLEPAPIEGGDGNREYLVAARKP